MTGGDVYSRPNVRQRDDGRWEFRASSLGSCDRALVMEALGQTPEPPPEHVQKGMDEGAAYAAMRRMAMDRNLKLVELARSLIAAAELLA